MSKRSLTMEGPTGPLGTAYPVALTSLLLKMLSKLELFADEAGHEVHACEGDAHKEG